MAWDSLLKSVDVFCWWSREGTWQSLRSPQVAHPTLLSLCTKMWIKMPAVGHLFGEFSWKGIKKILFSETEAFKFFKNAV